MKWLILLLTSLLLSVTTPETQARSFRSIEPIAQPGMAPAGASPVAAIQAVDRALVEQAVRDVARAWNSGELSELLADDFASKSRLEDTIAEVVPRDATLTVLGIQAVSTLDQYRQADGKIVSTVSAVVRSQIEYNAPEAGYQRREGTGEWYFRIEQTAPLPAATRIPSFLEEVLSAKSPDDVVDAFPRTVLTEEDRRQLGATLGRPPYASKLQSLAEELEGQLPRSFGVPTRNELLSDEAQLALAQRQADALALLNQPVRDNLMAAQGQAAPSADTPRPPPLTPPLRSQPSAAVTHSESPASVWRIDDVEPQPATVERQIRISGAGFGESEGNAELVFESFRFSVPLTIDSWSDGFILATLPYDVSFIFSEGVSTVLSSSTRRGMLWVKPREASGLGPTRDILIGPSPRSLEPIISVLSSDSVTPGQEITVAGHNFLPEYGMVEFHFGAHRFDGDVLYWRDDLIHVRLPAEIEGMTSTSGEVKVRNHYDKVATHDITFQPRLETVVLTNTEGHLCWGLLGFREYYQLWTEPLINEWRVVSTDRRKRNSTIFTGCEFLHQPTPGAGDATTEVVLWCDAFSFIPACEINLTIEGPAGTPHGTSGRRASPVPFR